jgi:hypothetical protein
MVEHRLDHLTVDIDVRTLAADTEVAGIAEQKRDSFGGVGIVVAVRDVEPSCRALTGRNVRQACSPVSPEWASLPWAGLTK